jgi:hypothetical protein
MLPGEVTELISFGAKHAATVKLCTVLRWHRKFGAKHASTVKFCTVLRWHRKFSCSFDISRPLTSKNTVSTHFLSHSSYSSIHLECQSHGLSAYTSLAVRMDISRYMSAQAIGPFARSEVLISV